MEKPLLVQPVYTYSNPTINVRNLFQVNNKGGRTKSMMLI